MYGGCFDYNKNGEEIVQFNTPSEDHQYILILQRAIDTVLCLLAVFWNVVLFIVIVKTKNDLARMKPIVIFICVNDVIMALTSLSVLPFINPGFGRIIVFANSGMHIKNRLLNESMMAVGTSWILFNWSTVPFQFLYRWHLVKFGDRPRGRFLACSILFVLAIFSVYCCCSLRLMHMFTGIDKTFLEDSERILKHAGYDIKQYEIYGTSMHDKSAIYFIGAFTLAMGTSYGIVGYCAIKIRKFLANRACSSATRRLNNSMDILLALTASIPVFTNMLPVCYLVLTITLCKNHPILDLVNSAVVHAALVISPVMTLWLIRPYRRVVLKWLGLEHKIRLSLIDSSLSMDKQKRSSIPPEWWRKASRGNIHTPNP
ncbi:hypothetical protein M3Y98_01224600 [Aphelenchoides besseyi]|nr:hypothetical protein M3Y98_01224600 [Aphelenchoides besseyi]KAI6193352.1 hypothetical protein M3Y96_01009000 [Aphelenchoides besseyi]